LLRAIALAFVAPWAAQPSMCVALMWLAPDRRIERVVRGGGAGSASQCELDMRGAA
jgi:hypothetical protein